MNHSTSTFRRILVLTLLTALLFPVLSAAAYATPLPETEPVPLPVWNGGAAEAFSGNGTESDPYLISTAEELALLAQKVRGGESFAGAYFLLTADLCLNDTSEFDQWEDHSPARRWIPIGGYATVAIDSQLVFDALAFQSGGLYLRTEAGYQPAKSFQSGVVYYRLTAFSGVFNGDGHTVYGLYSQGEPEYAGLFGACKNAVIKNINLSSAYVSGGEKVGGLAGALLADESLTVDQCHVEGNIRGEETVGGLIGYADSTESGKLNVNASSFNGKLHATRLAGGILGVIGNGNGALHLTACKNQGEITANETGGGIVGSVIGENATLLSCYNRGSVLCDENGGGIAGHISPEGGAVTVSDCQNSGTLLGERSQGGIAGAIPLASACKVEILSCRNVGEIYGKTSIGGIIGWAQVTDREGALQVTGCKNSAVIRGTQEVGGIIGAATVSSGSITLGSSENYGNITAQNTAGGILGSGSSTDTSNATLHMYECNSRATITATVSKGGAIVGKLHSRDSGSILLELSSAGGTVKALSAAGGIVGEVVSGTDDTQSTTDTANTDRSAPPSPQASEAGSFVEVRNCLCAATISAEESAGGIAGLMSANEGKSKISSSLFCGTITTGCKITGGIAAIAHAKQKDSTVEIVDCYYNENTSARAMLPQGGEGNESCLTTVALSEEKLRDAINLPGLDFTETWQESVYFPTLQAVPFVWEEYTYTVTQSGAILLAYTGRSDIARIPDKMGGIAVTTISREAFLGSTVIRVILPGSITAIGEAAFENCRQLEQITLSSALVSIGARAFANCTSLSELRCIRALSTLQVGSENEPFTALSLTHPVTLQVSHTYEDGSIAGKSGSIIAYPGDFYQIPPLEINGYKPDENTLSGICNGADRISVIYRIGSYRLTIRYLFPDGSEAFPSFEGNFQFGEQFRIPTPTLEGFTADRTLLEGVMDGKDIQYTVIFTEVFAGEDRQTASTLEIVLLIVAGLVMLGCLGYFIHRYRVITDLDREEAKSSLFN